MVNKYAHISQIENLFSKFLTRAKVSANVFVGEDLPATLDSSWEDMVLATPNSQADRTAYSSGSVSVFLFARPTGAKLVKNVKVLNRMEEALDTAIDAFSDLHYSMTINWRDQGYDSIRNLHYNVINLEVVVR